MATVAMIARKSNSLGNYITKSSHLEAVLRKSVFDIVVFVRQTEQYYTKCRDGELCFLPIPYCPDRSLKSRPVTFYQLTLSPQMIC